MSRKAESKKVLKLAGALVAATGIVTVGAVVASGAAIGALVEGFKVAGQTVKDVLAEDTTEEQVEVEAV